MATISQNLLELARSRVFSIGPRDTSARLAEDQASYGLARILYALQECGHDDSGAYTLFSPDASITRNKARWQAGYGYGCLVRFQHQHAEIPLFFPEIRPNACGMITFRIVGEIPAWDELNDRLKKLSDSAEVDGKKIVPNLGNSNHFVELYTVRESSHHSLSEGDKVGIIHTSPPEVKDGLYDLEALAEQGGRYIETPMGRIFILEGVSATRYFDHYKNVDEFSKKRRSVIANALFGEVEEISNHNHQGIFPDGTVRLGLYDTSSTNGQLGSNGAPIFPVTLRWDVPVRLYEGLPNISPQHLPPELYEDLGSLSVDVGHMNILPHGGGYKLHESIEYVGMEKTGDKTIVHTKAGDADYVFTDPSDLPYDYRVDGIFESIEKYQLGRCVAKLHQFMTVKY